MLIKTSCTTILLTFTSLIIVQLMTFVNSYTIHSDDCKESYCYDIDIEKQHRQLLGTKTSYPRYTDFDVNQEFIIPNCTPLKIWLVIRHAARFPTRKEMHGIQALKPIHEGFKKNYEKNTVRRKCRLCNVDVQLLRNWHLPHNFTDDTANLLVPEGYKQMKRLGESFQKMFPTLFLEKFSSKYFYFLMSLERRTKFSYRAFMEGLFGKDAYNHIPIDQDRDTEKLLKAYSYCKASKNNSEVFDNAKTSIWHIFRKTPVYQQVMRDVSFRLGFDYVLEEKIINSIWAICIYQQSWNIEKSSPWCSVLTPRHYPILNYADDLEYFHKKGFGSLVNIKLPCSVVNDMIYHLDSKDNYKVVTYIVHSTLLQSFQTSLGLFKDKIPLTPFNYHLQQNRTFMSNINMAIASNFGFVKYQCANKDITGNSQKSTEKIMFLHNQKPLQMDWCNGIMCDISDIQRRYRHFVALNCSSDFCDEHFKGFPEPKLMKSLGIKLYSLWWSFTWWICLSGIALR